MGYFIYKEMKSVLLAIDRSVHSAEDAKSREKIGMIFVGKNILAKHGKDVFFKVVVLLIVGDTHGFEVVHHSVGGVLKISSGMFMLEFSFQERNIEK